MWYKLYIYITNLLVIFLMYKLNYVLCKIYYKYNSNNNYHKFNKIY